MFLFSLVNENIILSGMISARRVGEIQELMSDPPYTVLIHIFIQSSTLTSFLKTHLKFLLMVVMEFHLNQQIHWPIFFLHASNTEVTLCILDIICAMTFFLQRTRPFRSSPKLFVVIEERMRGKAISAQRLSQWIFDCMRTCCEIARVEPPITLRTHWTRAQAASAALLKSVSILDICKAVTWVSLRTCSEHYAITEVCRSDATLVKSAAIFS